MLHLSTGAEAILPGFEERSAFLQGLLKIPSDGHRFADGFHLRIQRRIRRRKFFKIETRDFSDDVIECGFKTGRRRFGDIVA